jgi:hypothetical protein
MPSASPSRRAKDLQEQEQAIAFSDLSTALAQEDA